MKTQFGTILGIVLLALAQPLMALELAGQWVQGGLLIGSVDPGQQVIFMGKPLRVSPMGRFVIGLGRDAPAQVSLKVGQSVHAFAVRQRQYREQRVEGVPERTVTPPPEVMQRIALEAKLVREARASDDPREDFLSGFSRPLEGPITGVYGSRRVYNGVPKNPHFGLDIAAPTGALVVAPAPGVVRLVHNDMYFSGGTLVIDHGYGVSSTFIHLSELLVEPGAEVRRGDPIARVGATGRATGPHLDWRINWFDVRIDPALVLENFPVPLAE